ncbi:Solute carrier family 22 member 6-B, partial [Atta colombica]
LRDYIMRLCCLLRRNEVDPQSRLENEATNNQSIKNDIEKFGLYQIVIFAFIGITLTLTAAFAFSYMFITSKVKYRCSVPECEHAENTTFESPWLNASAPKINGVISRCTRYVVRNDNDLGTCTETSFTNVTRDCDSWIYDPNEYTILNEWGFTCDDNQWKLTLVGTIQNIGQTIGLIFTEYISDSRFNDGDGFNGSGVNGLIHSFSVNYYMFLVFQFLNAFIAIGIYDAGFILGMEMMGVKNRVYGSTIISSMYAMGVWNYGFLFLYMAEKLYIAIAFSTMYLFTELFPTTLRNSLLGICDMMSRIGSSLSPQIPLLYFIIFSNQKNSATYLQSFLHEIFTIHHIKYTISNVSLIMLISLARIMPSLPLILFGSMSMIAGILSLIFPETLGIKFPDTVREAEEIGKSNKTRKIPDLNTLPYQTNIR